jgi:hypothetical protein
MKYFFKLLAAAIEHQTIQLHSTENIIENVKAFK